MSTTRTFNPLTGGGVEGAYVSGNRWGYQTAEKVRHALDIALYLAGDGMDLGGSETTGLVTGAATWVPVANCKEFSLDGDSVGGLTLQAIVSYYTTSASTSVQVRVRNVTDGSNAALGTSSTSTTVVSEALTLTLASGVKTYRLEALGDATNAVVAWGSLRVRTVPS